MQSLFLPSTNFVRTKDRAPANYYKQSHIAAESWCWEAAETDAEKGQRCGSYMLQHSPATFGRQLLRYLCLGRVQPDCRDLESYDPQASAVQVNRNDFPYRKQRSWHQAPQEGALHIEILAVAALCIAWARPIWILQYFSCCLQVSCCGRGLLSASTLDCESSYFRDAAGGWSAVWLGAAFDSSLDGHGLPIPFAQLPIQVRLWEGFAGWAKQPLWHRNTATDCMHLFISSV